MLLITILAVPASTPEAIASTIVREEEFAHDYTLLPLTTKGEAIWQNAWSAFKAG